MTIDNRISSHIGTESRNRLTGERFCQSFWRECCDRCSFFLLDSFTLPLYYQVNLLVPRLMMRKNWVLGILCMTATATAMLSASWASSEGPNCIFCQNGPYATITTTYVLSLENNGQGPPKSLKMTITCPQNAKKLSNAKITDQKVLPVLLLSGFKVGQAC